jgi:hypothetical protein
MTNKEAILEVIEELVLFGLSRDVAEDIGWAFIDGKINAEILLETLRAIP